MHFNREMAVCLQYFLGQLAGFDNDLGWNARWISVEFYAIVFAFVACARIQTRCVMGMGRYTACCIRINTC